MIVYLMHLISEDLFIHLFQFIIIVVSTQFAYKLLTRKSFSIKRVIKYIQRMILNDKNEEPASVAEFVAEKLLIPHMKITKYISEL